MKTQNYLFSVNYWFRHVQNCEVEKDFENVDIVATSSELAIKEVCEKFNTPQRRVFAVDIKSQKITITKDEIFNLTSPEKSN